MGIVWGVSFFLFAIAYYFVITPQLKVKARLLKEATEKKEQFDMALNASLEDNKKKLAAEVESLKTRLSNYVSEYEDSPNLTFAVSRIAGDKQVKRLYRQNVGEWQAAGPACSQEPPGKQNGNFLCV